MKSSTDVVGRNLRKTPAINLTAFITIAVFVVIAIMALQSSRGSCTLRGAIGHDPKVAAVQIEYSTQATKGNGKGSNAWHFHGQGLTRSKLFTLHGPQAKLILRVSGGSSQMIATAQLVSSKYVLLYQFAAMVYTEKTDSSETTVMGVKPGKYFIMVSTNRPDFDWDVTVSDETN
jgi:hypothetical protein